MSFNLISLYLLLQYIVVVLSFKTYSSINNKYQSPRSFLKTDSNDIDNLKIDESKLNPEERERIKFIQKLSLEADDIIRKAGLNPDNEDTVNSFNKNDEESDDDILSKTKFVTVADTKW